MHVAVGLFNNRSQKRSEYSRNISDTLGCINPICDLLINQQIAIWNLFFHFIQFVTPHEHFVVSKKCTFFQNSRIPCCNNCFCSCNDFQVEEVNQCFFFPFRCWSQETHSNGLCSWTLVSHALWIIEGMFLAHCLKCDKVSLGWIIPHHFKNKSHSFCKEYLF